MVGAAIKGTATVGDGTSGSIGPTFIWRLRSRHPRAEDRFVFAYRYGAYTADLSSPFGDGLDVGRARLRPLLVGFDYKMPRGRWNWAAGVTAGYSVNSMKRLHTPGVVAELSDSFALSPRVRGWYDVNRKMSLLVESFYMYDRPTLEIRGDGSSISRRLNADAFIVKTGIVYQVW